MDLSLYLYPVAHDQSGLRDLWARFAEQGDEANRAGWRGIWTPEHHLARGFFPPPMQLLTWCAARYPSMSAGTAVALAPLYHPLHLAEAIATLSTISAGTYFGFGTGFRQREFKAVGADMTEKVANTCELAGICRALLQGEKVSFEVGPWKGADVALTFAAAPMPKFLAAARTSAEVRYFADVADGIIPNPMSGFDGQLSLLDQMDEALGHPAPVRPVIADVVYGKTEAIARQRAVRRLGAEYRSFKHQRSAVPDIARFAASPEDQIEKITDYAIIGDSTIIAERLAALAMRGVTDVLVRAEQADTTQAEILEAISALGELLPSVAAVSKSADGGRHRA